MDPKTMNLEGKIAGYEKKTLVIAAIVIIAAGAVFYAGAKYEKHKLSALGLLVNKSANKKAAVNSIKGIVTAKDDKSVTIKMTDGTTRNIQFSNSMTFGTDGAGSAADVFVGELLVIAGENNADGIFTPTNMRASKKSPKAPAPQEETAPSAETSASATKTVPTTVPAPTAK
ncbi:MAG: hypothetical protein WC022_04275 [Parcubacteria group bacterium]